VEIDFGFPYQRYIFNSVIEDKYNCQC